MENQDLFREALGDLLELAKASGLVLEEAQIEEAFTEFSLTEDQKNLVYTYLEMNQVKVVGHEADRAAMDFLKGSKKEEPEKEAPQKKLTGEDSKVYKMYLEEIEKIPVLSGEEREILLAELSGGSTEARNRLVEGSLQRVVELAAEYAGKGVLLGDLVQEGNMALLLAMDLFDGSDFGVYITREICTALDAAVSEQSGEENNGSYLAAQANAMMEATEELVKDLGREATLEEISRKMNLSEDMVRDIMKISMDALNVVDANGGTEVFGQD